MALTITHAKVTTGAVDDSVEVDLQDWNDNHTIAGSVAASEVTSPAALTKTDDTNVTLTLGGSPTTALLAATSITVGWTSVLAASRGGTGVANNDASTITISGSFGLTFTLSATTSLTLPTTGTLATLAGAEALSGKTSVSSAIYTGPGKVTFQSNGTTFAGSISTGQQWMFNANDVAPATGVEVTISKNTAAPSQATLGGSGKTNVALQLGTADGSQGFVVFDNYGNTSGPSFLFRSGRGTQASPTATQSGDFLFNFYGQGYATTVSANFGAFFGAIALENFTDSAQGNAWVYWTTTIGGTGLAERLRIARGLMVGLTTDPGDGAIAAAGSIKSISATGGIGYATGAGGAVTQDTSRTTGVTLNKVCGAITLFSAAGSATYQSFTVTNSAVVATDVIKVNQKSGTDLYEIHVTAVASGSFRITYRTTGGTTTEQPVFNFAIIKGVVS